jgi:hypothetical protein
LVLNRHGGSSHVQKHSQYASRCQGAYDRC